MDDLQLLKIDFPDSLYFVRSREDKTLLLTDRNANVYILKDGKMVLQVHISTSSWIAHRVCSSWSSNVITFVFKMLLFVFEMFCLSFEVPTLQQKYMHAPRSLEFRSLCTWTGRCLAIWNIWYVCHSICACKKKHHGQRNFWTSYDGFKRNVWFSSDSWWQKMGERVANCAKVLLMIWCVELLWYTTVYAIKRGVLAKGNYDGWLTLIQTTANDTVKAKTTAASATMSSTSLISVKLATWANGIHTKQALWRTAAWNVYCGNAGFAGSHTGCEEAIDTSCCADVRACVD